MLVPVAFALATQVAAPSSTPDPAAEAVLVVRCRGGLGLAEATVQRALEGHLADLGYAVHVDFAPGDRPWPKAPVRVELQLRDDGGVTVSMQRDADGQPWERALGEQVDPQEPDLWLESLGILVRSMLGAPAVEAAPPEPEPEPEPEPPPEPESPPEPEPEQSPRSSLDVAAGYRGDTLAPGHRWHSAAALDLTGRWPGGFTLGGTFAYTPAHDGGGLALQRVGALLHGGFAWRPDARLQPSLKVAVSADALGWSKAPPGARARPGWDARVGAGLALELRAFVTARWFLAVRARATGWIRGVTLRDSVGTTLVETGPISGAVWVGVGHRWTLPR